MKSVFAAFSLLAITTTVQADCKSDIQGILRTLESAGPYRMELSSKSGDQKQELKGEVIMPHSLRVTGEGLEMVMTPNGVWMAQGGKPLSRMPDDMRDQLKDMITQGMNLGVRSVENAECLGSADFEGKSYSHYKYTSKVNFMGIDSNSKVDMYVKPDGKPEWLLIEGEALGFKSTTRQHIVFDDNITIADPK